MESTSLTVSKAQFKPHVLEYLRLVEKDKKPLTITHAGKPVVQIVPFGSKKTDDEILQGLRGSVLKYDDPTEPVGLDDWELLK